MVVNEDETVALGVCDVLDVKVTEGDVDWLGEALPDDEELRVKLWDGDPVGLVDSVGLGVLLPLEEPDSLGVRDTLRVCVTLGLLDWEGDDVALGALLKQLLPGRPLIQPIKELRQLEAPRLAAACVGGVAAAAAAAGWVS